MSCAVGGVIVEIDAVVSTMATNLIDIARRLITSEETLHPDTKDFTAVS